MLKAPNAAPGRSTASILASAAEGLLQTFQRPDRSRSLWQFMAWCFIVAESFQRGAWLGGEAIATGDDDAGRNLQAGPTLGPILASDDQVGVQGAHHQTSSALPAPPMEPLTIHVEMQIETSHGPVSSGTSSLHLQYTHQIAVSAVGAAASSYVTEFSGPGFTFGTEINLPPWMLQPSMAFDPDSLKFFDGLKTFTDGLGFIDSPFDLAKAAPGSSEGLIGVALDFTQSSLTPIAFWQSLGHYTNPIGPTTADRFDVDWLVQLNGVKQGEFVQAERVSGFAATEHDIARDLTAHNFGNEAKVVDGHDWTGTLWVSGNYYEFNTIIQVNILWDNDKITYEDFRSPGGTGSALSIASGGNTQINTAKLGVDTAGGSEIALSGDDTIHQLVMGGRTEHSAAYQVNSIIDTDSLSFNLELLLGDALGSIDFAAVFAAGHIQSNDSTIVSTNDGLTGGMSAREFYSLKHHGEIKYVNGDYYEFNTIVQMNVIFDRDEITALRADDSDPLASSGGVIASGGTLQFNRASMSSNDRYDDLFVGGQYSQYNLVLQINALDDSDLISQTRGMVRQPGDSDLDHSVHDGVDGTRGDDGHGNSEYVTANSLDDHLSRHDMLS